MFVPLSIKYPYQRIPFATLAIVLLNVGIHHATRNVDPRWFPGYMLDPNNFELHQLVTSCFLHGDFWHVFFNMLFALVYGRYVEDRLGALRFTIVYLACGVAGGLAYLATDATRPAIGASAATAGLMGYVLIAAPAVQIRFVIFMWPIVGPSFRFAVAWLLVPWIIFQIALADMGDLFGIAFSAHIGGFACGAVLAAVMRSPLCRGTKWTIAPPRRGGKAAVLRLKDARGPQEEDE